MFSTSLVRLIVGAIYELCILVLYRYCIPCLEFKSPTVKNMARFLDGSEMGVQTNYLTVVT